MSAPLLRDLRSADWDTDASPVVLFLHGYGSNERDLTGLAPALDLPLRWASLRAPLDMAHGGAAWFEVIVPGNPEPAAVDAATDRIWEWVDAHVGADATIVPVGFSQGGLMASQLLRTRPDRVAATVILGGFVSAAPQPGDAVIAASRPAVFWGRGAEDHVIAAPAIARTIDFLPEHASLVERVYPGLGHGISAAEVADVRSFITEHVAGALPARDS